MKLNSKIVVSVILVATMLAAFAGCTTTGGADKPTEYMLASLPNDGGEITPGTQQVIDEMNKALAPFNATVTYVACDDYSVVSESILSGTAHFGTPSGATFTKAHLEDNNVIPMFTRGPAGDVTKGGYDAYICTHIDNKDDFAGMSEEEALLSLKGKSFSFVSATSTSGRLVPTTTLWSTFGPDGSGDVSKRNQIFEHTIDDGGIFSEVQFGGNHPGSLNLVLEKKVYAGAFCCSNYTDNKEKLHVISHKVVPPGPYWVNSSNVKREHIDALVKHFTNLDDTNAPEGFFADEDGALPEGWRYVAVDHTFYNFLKDMYAGE